MAPLRATLRDVAALAGVHSATASRALNESTRSLVNADTVRRVTEAAETLGYRPNHLARSFKTRRTYSIGVLIPDITNPMFPPTVRGIEDRLALAGYVALLGNTENDAERERRILGEMEVRHVDGLVLATARRQDPLLVGMSRLPTPIVLVNRIVEDHAFCSVSVDDAAGIRLVVDHLRALGHERIAHLAGPQELSTGYGRRQGFLAAMAEAGLSVDDRLVVCASAFSVDEGIRCATALLSGRRRPTALVAGNDMLALGCYSAMEAAGLRCPDDVSVAGFNDMPFVDRLAPPLTTVHIPHAEIGTRAADLMLERIDRPEAMPERVVLEPELIVRGSTAPPA